MDIAFVKYSCSTVVDGRPVKLVADEAWDAADPVVRARPDLFVDRPEHVQTSAEATTAPVEQATAAPGAKRATKRAARKG